LEDFSKNNDDATDQMKNGNFNFSKLWVKNKGKIIAGF
jgi:hypothetical protein